MFGGMPDAEGKRDEYRSSTANIHNDNIGADLPDIFEWNDIFRLASEQAGKFVFAGNDDFAYLAGTFVEFQIADFSKTFAVFQVNDFLTFQF